MVETFVQSTDDVVKFLKAQHNLIKDMFDEVLSRVGTESARESVRRPAPAAGGARDRRGNGGASAGRHEVADGDEIVDARLQEEHKAKEKLSKLESMDYQLEGVH